MNAWRPMLACVLVAAAAPALAQTSYVAPAIAVGIAYDDNVFALSDEQVSDTILRVTPTLEAGFMGPRGNARVLHSFDAEKYQEQSELDGVHRRRYTEVDLDYRFTRRLEGSLMMSAAATDVADELAPEFGLETGRAAARRTTMDGGFEYRFTERTTGLASFELARDDLVRGSTVDTVGGRAGVTHRFTPRDTWTMDLTRREYDFQPGGKAHSTILMGGWIGEVTERTTLTVQAGPRDTEVGTRAEVYLAAHHRIPGGDFTVNYARSERVILGQAGLAETDSVWMAYTHPINPAMTLRVIPSFTALARDDDTAETYRFALEATYRFTPLVSALTRYQWSRQRGSLEFPGPVEFSRNLVYFGVTVAFSPRVGQVPPAELRTRR